MTVEAVAKSDRIRSPDILRALAITYIVGIHHIDDYASNCLLGPLDIAITRACLGVLVYLSGYLLGGKYHSLSNLHEVGLFFKKRFLRIYPLYLLALALFALCSLTSYRWFLRSALLLDMFWGSANLTLWFISMICFCYLLFPITVFKAHTRSMVLRMLFFCAAVAGLRLFWRAVDIRMVLYMPVFFVGVLASRSIPVLSARSKGAFAAISFLLCCLLFILFFGRAPVELRSLPVLLFILTALYPILYVTERLAPLVDSRIFARISYASYCMYLFHRVVYLFLLRIHSPQTGLSTMVYLGTVGLPLVYVMSAAAQSLYDRLYARIMAIWMPGGRRSFAGTPQVREAQAHETGTEHARGFQSS